MDCRLCLQWHCDADAKYGWTSICWLLCYAMLCYRESFSVMRTYASNELTAYTARVHAFISHLIDSHAVTTTTHAHINHVARFTTRMISWKRVQVFDDDLRSALFNTFAIQSAFATCRRSMRRMQLIWYRIFFSLDQFVSSVFCSRSCCRIKYLVKSLLQFLIGKQSVIYDYKKKKPSSRVWLLSLKEHKQHQFCLAVIANI